MLARGIALGLLIVAAKVSYGDETPLQLSDGRHAPSPDGKLYVFYDAPTFQIRDRKTSAVLGSVDQEQPVEAVRWTGHSKTLIVVEHIAQGSGALFFDLGRSRMATGAFLRSSRRAENAFRSKFPCSATAFTSAKTFRKDISIRQ